MNGWTIKTGVALAALVIFLMAPASVRADAVADFYRGKKVTLYVGYGAGGGFDTRARILAQHMGKHIPGNPEIVVQNMPGAGSKRLANHIYNVAAKDGTEIGSINQSMATNSLLKVPGTEFEGSGFTWIGSLLKSPAICFAWSGSGFESLADLKSKKFIVGATGTGSTTYILPITMNRFLDTKIDAIPGYKGSKGLMLAMEQGEIHGICGIPLESLIGAKPEWVSEGKVKILAQMGLEKDANLPDIPLLLDLAPDQNRKAAWKLLFANRSMGNPFLAPPGIPQDRKETLRRAFDATMKDAEFLAEMRRLGTEVQPSTGEEIDVLLQELYASPNEVLEMAIDALAKK